MAKKSKASAKATLADKKKNEKKAAEQAAAVEVTATTEKETAEKAESEKSEAPAPKPEETKAEKSKSKAKEEKPKEEPKVEKSKTDEKPPKAPKKNEDVIIPEVVEQKPEETKKEEVDPVPALGKSLAKMNVGERIDANHAIDLMKLVHTEYVANPATSTDVARAMKKQFDVMALMSLLQYNAQVEADFKTLGVKVNNSMFVQMEKVARETLGITLKGLPCVEDPAQKVIDFSNSVPAEVKEEVKKDIKAMEKPIPEADPKLPDPEKLMALRAIFARKDGIGQNLMTGIEWARKAFSFEEGEKKAVVLANILQKGASGILLTCLTSMIHGNLMTNHSILGAHALMKRWCPSTSDQEVAEIIQVLSAYRDERAVNDANGKSKSPKYTLEGELAITNSNILTSAAGNVIDAILSGKDEVIAETKQESPFDKVRVDTKKVRTMLVATYGDSENILKDKINEIIKYYVKPVVRLTGYVDKSAYSA